MLASTDNKMTGGATPVPPSIRAVGNIPPSRHGIVFAPTVSADHGELLSVDCRYRADDSPQRWVATGLGVDPAALEAILTESRDGESGPDALAKVRISIHPREPVGSSHGLAVALADKMSRYPLPDTPRAVFATGMVPRNGRGALAPVERFEEKVRLVADMAPEGSFLAYCTANHKDAADLLRVVAAEGNIRLLPANNINDLAELWNEARERHTVETATLPKARRLSGKAALALSAMMMLVGTVVFLLKETDSPDVSEQVVQQSEATQTRVRNDTPDITIASGKRGAPGRPGNIPPPDETRSEMLANDAIRLLPARDWSGDNAFSSPVIAFPVNATRIEPARPLPAASAFPPDENERQQIGDRTSSDSFLYESDRQIVERPAKGTIETK